jgi:hypothetical protein
MGSGAMVYVASFITICLASQMLVGDIHIQHGHLVSLLLFLRSMETKLKIKVGL